MPRVASGICYYFCAHLLPAACGNRRRRYTGKPSQTSCDNCPHGRFGIGDGLSVCEVCQIGKFQADTGHTTCHACSNGTYAAHLGQSQCGICHLGYFSNAHVSLTTCTRCGDGAFSSEAESSTCKQCPVGTVPNLEKGGCVACEPGFFARVGFSECASCGVGRFSIIENATDCVDCDVGQFNADASATYATLATQTCLLSRLLRLLPNQCELVVILLVSACMACAQILQRLLRWALCCGKRPVKLLPV